MPPKFNNNNSSYQIVKSIGPSVFPIAFPVKQPIELFMHRSFGASRFVCDNDVGLSIVPVLCNECSTPIADLIYHPMGVFLSIESKHHSEKHRTIIRVL